MNEANLVHLEGSVRPDVRGGDNWSRYTRGGRGQVRFWLAVSRDLAGSGLDYLLCAIEPKSGEELSRYERELRSGRTVKLTATARALAPEPREDSAGVIFVAEECGFDGMTAHGVHQRPRHTIARGKSAAAGDWETAEAELQLGFKR